ncbi:beta-lactamase [Pantoea sp. RIT-PI-b]|uniref:MBL fold metallo-hydrolase n=1 Tax=Pantoea sp. RIT-PI-b TaxID=1681195 RepID=UPI0006769340|nr:MBL fold metallo-hydrolase [Pantoea sp. RIT-PI-b]KNC05777.1 beta-lactamase [Pantoea sp. RIT-PI-b]
MNTLFHSYDIGDYHVTAISDGEMTASLNLLSGIENSAAVNIQQCNGIIAPDNIHIYCYLIRGQGRIILVDAGMGKLNHVGGELKQNLFLLGVAPEDIDTVLLTHGHPDHIGGLQDERGRPTFGNAELYLSQAEADFWRDEAQLSRLNERAQMNGTRVRRTLDAYQPKLRFTENAVIAKGISAVCLPGHTPGHTGYLIESCQQRLLIWGDIAHYPHIQIAHPEISIAFDNDPLLAENTRKELLARVARENLLIAGMHFGVTGFAYIRCAAEGQYVLEYV